MSNNDGLIRVLKRLGVISAEELVPQDTDIVLDRIAQELVRGEIDNKSAGLMVRELVETVSVDEALLWSRYETLIEGVFSFTPEALADELVRTYRKFAKKSKARYPAPN